MDLHSSFSEFMVESQRSLEDQLHAAANELLLQHFKELVAEELTRVQCPQYDVIDNQVRTHDMVTVHLNKFHYF